MDAKRAYSAADEQLVEYDPKPTLTIALVTTMLAFLLTCVFPVLVGWATVIRIILLVLGVLGACIAIYFQSRSPVVLGLAAVAFFFAAEAIAAPMTWHDEAADLKPEKPQNGPLTAQGRDVTLSSSEGEKPIPVATFDNSTGAGSQVENATKAYTASIHWADGYTSPGMIEPNKDRTFVVKASRALEEEGFYPGQVTIKGPGDVDVIVNFTARVSTWSFGRLLLRVMAVVALGAALVMFFTRPGQRQSARALLVLPVGGIGAFLTKIAVTFCMAHLG